jgi:hypothetical protein
VRNRHHAGCRVAAERYTLICDGPYNVPAGAFDIQASTVADLSNASDGNTSNNEVILVTFTE